MRIRRMKKILKDAIQRGYFQMKNGTQVTTAIYEKVDRRLWSSPQSEIIPEGVTLTDVFRNNGAT